MWKLFEYRNKEYYEEIEKYRYSIFKGTKIEDSLILGTARTYSQYHAFNPYTGKGIDCHEIKEVEHNAKGRADTLFRETLGKYKWAMHSSPCWWEMWYHTRRAYRYLGRALHVLQDMSVPWHTTLEGNNLDDHIAYEEEDWVDESDKVRSLAHRANKIIEKGGKFTLSAWIYLKAYPENWQNRAPIVSKGGIHTEQRYRCEVRWVWKWKWRRFWRWKWKHWYCVPELHWVPYWVTKPQWEYALYVYNNGNAGLSIWQPNGSLHVEIRGGKIPLNEWTFVCGVYDYRNKIAKLYINTELIAQSSNLKGKSENGDFSLLIGARSDGQYLHAIIDEVRLYSEALSETQIEEIYKGKEVYPESGGRIYKEGYINMYL
jgi:hypothetical protein